ncbi:hypothetical protein KIH74_24670 [Kineosporia sp. J2-2]|uniref:SWIM-type domain-containing protein n=1 Tax=Kineosporia corallincola TaxID=2835133 RepID=A0ABS5TM50_9ACTN|nr:hypothetical protein [Kineosporia corallincola]MBT0772161.1 hypothetical protein [Kineosporia corallincola]
MNLPPADPLLVAQTLEALPARLRQRLDATVSGASGWIHADGVVDVGGAHVTLTPENGALRQAENVRCDCLLAPACLHRAGVLSVAPVAGSGPDDARGGAPGGTRGGELDGQPGDRPDGESGGSGGSEKVFPAADSMIRDPSGDVAEDPWKPAEKAAAQALWRAAAQVLEAGLAGAGVAVQGRLLAGVHQARLRTLHRLAAAATRVVTGIRQARSDAAAFSLPQLTADLLEVLSVAHAVISGTGRPEEWRGTARTVYAPVGGLRLAGLCLEPVISSAGYAGAVVWLTDAEGRLWSVSDVKPGGPERVPSSAASPVAIGETGLSHRNLSRAGLIMASATANPDGRLGAGQAVRAVRAAGVAWTEPQLLGRFGRIGGHLHGNNREPRLLALTVCGSDRDAVLAVDPAGEGVRLVVPGGGHRQIQRDNLRLIAARPGLRMLAVARPLPGEEGGAHRFLGLPGTLELIAVGGGDLRLPAVMQGRVDVGFDRLSARFLRPSGPAPQFPQAAEVTDPLAAYRRRLERVVSGGRRTLSVPGVPRQVRSEAALLRREQLGTAAMLLEALLDAAQPATHDVFGRLTGDSSTTLARAWLTAGAYQRELLSAPY